jgi:hypothetical protein|tara:strand:+ start:1904 stop:2146 length:243 start_codon:yes stop_codon:yes gene_type:complete
MKFISIPVFIISLAIGLFLAYITTPSPGVIYVYPNPDNIDKIQFKDEGGTCFGFKTNEVKCPSDDKLIRRYPMQTFEPKK